MQAYMPEELAYYQNAASSYTTAHQDNFDKYGLFIERALALLQPDGRLGLIVPHKFMTIQAGRALRQLITERQLLDQVVHFGVKPVFGRAISNYTCILILERRGSDSVRVEKVGRLEPWRYGEPGIITEIPADDLDEEAWQFADSETRALFDRIRAQFPTRLGELSEIFVGVQNSADKIYIFRSVNETKDTVSLDWNGKEWPIERAILRPCLHDVQLAAYARPQPNAWMIFPYRLVAGKKKTEARLIQPGEMANDFPGGYAYLKARQGELEKRNISGGPAADRQFYQFGRSQSLAKFDSPKIILPILSVESRYAYDDSNVVVTGGGNGPYYMIRPKPGVAVTNNYLLAVLNHAVSEAFVRTNTSPFRGGYYSHGKQFIENLPIPLPVDAERAAIEGLVDQVITALQAVDAARTPHERILRERQVEDLRRQIEDGVTAAFGLSDQDLEIIRAVPVPT
jgi:hypothetical protein